MAEVIDRNNNKQKQIIRDIVKSRANLGRFLRDNKLSSFIYNDEDFSSLIKKFDKCIKEYKTQEPQKYKLLFGENFDHTKLTDIEKYCIIVNFEDENESESEINCIYADPTALLFIENNIEPFLNAKLKESLNNKQQPIVDKFAIFDQNHHFVMMFYNGKITVIDSSDYFEHSTLYIVNKKFFEELKKGEKFIILNKQLQKSGYQWLEELDRIREKNKYKLNLFNSIEYPNNPYKYNLLIGNCIELSDVFQEIIKQKIKKINNIKIIKELKDKLVKYSNKNHINEIENIDKDKLECLNYIKEQTINAYIKSKYFENDVNKFFNKQQYEYELRQTQGEEKNNCNHINDDNYNNSYYNDEIYKLYQLKTYNFKNQTKICEFFKIWKDLKRRKEELEKNNSNLYLEEVEFNTYDTNINSHSLEPMKYEYNKWHLKKEDDIERLSMFQYLKKHGQKTIAESIKNKAIEYQTKLIKQHFYLRLDGYIIKISINNDIKTYIRDVSVLQAIKDELDEIDKRVNNIKNGIENIKNINNTVEQIMDATYKDKKLNRKDKYIYHFSTWYLINDNSARKQRIYKVGVALEKAKNKLKEEMRKIKIRDDKNLSSKYTKIIAVLDKKVEKQQYNNYDNTNKDNILTIKGNKKIFFSEI